MELGENILTPCFMIKIIFMDSKLVSCRLCFYELIDWLVGE